MKKILMRASLLAFLLVIPIPAIAEVDVSINISLPPPFVFASPPEVVVIPETYVYVVPDAGVDIFFYNGWWWRPWEGRWYRSQHYNSGWGYYQNVPSFYREVPRGWRNDYRAHRWKGHPWNYQRIPHQQVQQNWNSWEKNRHWEKQNTWGVKGLKPRPGPQHQYQATQPRHKAPQQSRQVQSNHKQQQYRDAPQQSKSGHGKPEKEKKGKSEKDKKGKDK